MMGQVVVKRAKREESPQAERLSLLRGSERHPEVLW